MAVRMKRGLFFVLVSILLVGAYSHCLWAAEQDTDADQGPLVEVDEAELDPESISLRYQPGKGLRIGDHVTIFGYGELHYNNPIGTSQGDQFDFHRFVIGVGAEFTDWLIFESEIDFEHAAQDLELEIAFLDFLVLPEFNVRTGVVLAPVGFLNEHHEPTLYYSVERPLFDTIVIPTSWSGAALGFHGETDFGLEYRTYVMQSLDATGFSGSEGLRGGVLPTDEAPGTDVAGTARIAYNGVSGLQVGASVWVGATAQGNPLIDTGLVTIAEGDIRYSIEGVELTFAGAWTFIQDASGINNAIIAQDPTFTDFVASQIVGGYAELAYHVFHQLWPTSPVDIVVFGRHERINTQHKMPAGFASDPANNQRRTTVGLAVYPIKQVAIKFDYSFNRNDAGTGQDQFDAGIAFVY